MAGGPAAGVGPWQNPPVPDGGIGPPEVAGGIGPVVFGMQLHAQLPVAVVTIHS